MLTLDDYKLACNFPGVCDDAAVTAALAEYLNALGIKRQVRRLRRGWRIDDEPALRGHIEAAARAASAALDALAARAASAALDALDASQRFAEWCIGYTGYWYTWDLSWIVCAAFGARQRRIASVSAWSEPLLAAYCAGCWRLIWTETALYWVAKPALVRDAELRLHCATGPALIADDLDAHFWRGTHIPSSWITDCAALTAADIFAEPNAETRRAGCEIIGWDRVLVGINASLIDDDGDPQIGVLYEGQIPGASRCGFLKVRCGTGRDFVIPVPSGMASAIEAQAWIQGVKPSKWIKPEVRG